MSLYLCFNGHGLLFFWITWMRSRALCSQAQAAPPRRRHSRLLRTSVTNKGTLEWTYMNLYKNIIKKQGHRINLRPTVQATDLQQAQSGAFPEASLCPVRPQCPARSRVLQRTLALPCPQPTEASVRKQRSLVRVELDSLKCTVLFHCHDSFKLV
jgi:hypothetical protein